MAERIKGQEVVARFIKGGQVIEEITDIQDIEIEFQMDLLSEGYLGETTDRKDDVFRGVRGRFTIHTEDAKVLNFINDVVERARRKQPMFQVDLMAVFQYPSGQAPKILLPDCRFSAIPFGFASRTAYGTLSYEFETAEYKIIST